MDVDNALLNNDHIGTDRSYHLAQEFGEKNRDRYWDIVEALRKDLGYADYLGALQRYPGEPQLNHDNSTNALIRRYRRFKESPPCMGVAHY